MKRHHRAAIPLRCCRHVPHNGHTDAKTEAGAPAGTLGGEKRIEQFSQGFRLDASAVVLHVDEDAIASLAGTNLDVTAGANLSDGLFGVADQVEENLDQLVGIANNNGKIRNRKEIGLHTVAAQGMLVQLQGPLNDAVEVDRLFSVERQAVKIPASFERCARRAGAWRWVISS